LSFISRERFSDIAEKYKKEISAAIFKYRNINCELFCSYQNREPIQAQLMARELYINYIQFIAIRNKKLHKEELSLLVKDKKYLIIGGIYDTGATF
jgi:hypothetical protein